MSNLHLYTAPAQPATCVVDRTGDVLMTFAMNPRATLFTDCCRVRRWAQNVVMQVYYDGFRRWCAPGHGCEKGQTE